VDEKLYTLDVGDLDALDTMQKHFALTALESGKVVYFPSYFYSSSAFSENLLSESILDGKHKNISFDRLTGRLGGFQKQHADAELPLQLKVFMQNYANFAKQIIDSVFPQYSKSLLWGRTSYRPAEIKGRVSSRRKDDTLLHVDSFSATPVNGLRILRVFCNINPYGAPRVWDLGESFSKVMQRFARQIPDYSAKKARLLKMLKVTKTLRSAYDHYQLHLHDTMKLDDDYQKTVKKYRMDFPAQSTWLVFTDHVSHAAHSGQFLLEQTFYLPASAMATPELSPLKYWERERSSIKNFTSN
jgi:hypothetical protein